MPENVPAQEMRTSRAARAASLNQVPCVLWLTGRPAAGKSTLADGLEVSLHARGIHTYTLDGDNVRRGLNSDLGFNDADRVENIRRVAEVAKLMVDAGLIVIVSLISPFRAERGMARSLFEEGRFLEVFVDAPLELAEARDPKGHYARARRHEITNFTGIDSPYEPPESPEIRIDTNELAPEACVQSLLGLLVERGVLPAG
jgi:bifunctional enzyme CysN/CysC